MLITRVLPLITYCLCGVLAIALPDARVIEIADGKWLFDSCPLTGRFCDTC
jgi:hypothetical protein